MTVEFVQLNLPTSTGALIAVDILDTLGTATHVAVQRVKPGYGTDGIYNDTATNSPFPVLVETFRATGTLNIAAATGSITVIQPTATNLNVAMSSAATIPAAIGTWTATGQVLVSYLASATAPVSLLTLPTTATMPVSVATGSVFNIQQMSTATSPVSVGTWTATGVLFINNAGTATIFVAVQNTATVNIANTATVNIANTATIQGNVGGRWAHDATSTGNPIYIGAIAEATFSAGVADGDVTNLIADKHGRIINMPFGGRDNIFKYYLTVSATTVATLATGAGTAGVFRDLVSLVAFNNATTEARFNLKSSSSSTEFELNLAPDGGGIMFSPPRPWVQSVAATEWTGALNAAITGQLSIGMMFMETT